MTTCTGIPVPDRQQTRRRAGRCKPYRMLPPYTDCVLVVGDQYRTGGYHSAAGEPEIASVLHGTVDGLGPAPEPLDRRLREEDRQHLADVLGTTTFESRLGEGRTPDPSGRGGRPHRRHARPVRSPLPRSGNQQG
jgi:hypothetical protein